MYKPANILLVTLYLFSTSLAARQIEGVNIPEKLELANSNATLVLNGAGIREKFFLDIYIGALYLPAATPDASAILSDDGPASVLMHILYSEVSKKKITDGWNDGLEANLSEKEMQALKPRLEKFNNLFQTMHKGDRLRLDYIPGTGTEVRINGEWRGVVGGNDFCRSLLKIWIGSDPVSNSLKQEMLGNQ